MTLNETGQRPSTRRQLPSISTIWFILSTPEMLSLSLLLLTGVFALFLIIPQQSGQISTPANFVIWVSNLPSFFQQVFRPLETLGLFRIANSVWFWLPLAWLTLVCLIIVADYLPPTVQKLWPNKSQNQEPLPHPLRHKATKTIRLSAPKDASESAETDEVLATLENNLKQQKYVIVPTEDTLAIVAYRHRWRWIGPLGLALGLLIVIAGIVIQGLWGQSEEVLIAVQNANPVVLAGQTVSVNGFQPIPDRQGNLIAGSINLASAEAAEQSWQLYRPYRLGGWWVVPGKIQGTAEVTFNRQTTSEKSVFVFEDVARPILFVRSPENITFQLSYITSYQAPGYQLKPLNVDEAVEVNQRGEFFSIPAYNLQGQVKISNRVLLKAYKIPGLPLFVLGGLVFATGLILLCLSAPATVYLQAIKKGRGSKIRAEVETLGHTPRLTETFDTALNLPSLEEEDV